MLRAQVAADLPGPPGLTPLPVLPTTAPLPAPPFVSVPGLANLRDVGGYPIAAQSGASQTAVRRGVLFRSAELSRVGEKGVAALRELNITHVFDLRSAKEFARKNDGESFHGHTDSMPTGWEAERVFVPVFLDQDYSPAAIAERFNDYADGTEGFVRAYSTILDAAVSPDNTYQPYRTILNHLGSSSSPSPILVHCTAGKDRTGLICAIVLALLGVKDDIIAHEYNLTDLGLASRKEEIVQQLISRPALFGDRPRAERMVTARYENMLATLAMIREKYGSVESYVVDHCRVSRETVEQLRKNLVVNVSDT
ncbi:protein-tyrosine phosphatase-like protein [Podospora aff. communis PSN243]|uniref:Protein-tyrosine phosphatase-like protein n=1 Tax=Podospora aff. communis PSN243 TaxID=3040156 RepID=A0AAV9G6R2_9PEZI|nr:protein-tyrosine phosphatase-like protein [Podospora aff. communis PSN243]